MINIEIPFLSNPFNGYPSQKTFVSTMDDGSVTWKNADICFNWVAADFPYPHTHTNWELHVQLRGTLSHRVNKTVQHLHVGDVCLIRPSDRHSFSRTDGGEVLLLAFSINNDYFRSLTETIYKGLYEELESATNPPVLTASKYVLESFLVKMSGVQRFVTEQKEQLERNIVKTKLYFQEFFLHFLGNWMEDKGSFPIWLESLLRELSLNEKSLTLSPEELAARTPYSYSRMAAIFKQYVGESPAQYMGKLKMTYAANLLEHSEKSILEIALDCGYESLSSFNHRFTAQYGISPSTYRKQRKMVPPPQQ